MKKIFLAALASLMCLSCAGIVGVNFQAPISSPVGNTFFRLSHY